MKSMQMKTKVCLVGDAAVGKTSLIRRFVLNEFDDKYILTVGTKVCKKQLKVLLPEIETQVECNVMIWDIMGQKGFRDLFKTAYFYHTEGIIAVCDVTRYPTMITLNDWIKNVNDIAGNVPVMLVANKVDLNDKIEFGEEEMSQIAKIYDSPFFFSSAKTGKNVETVFHTLVERITTKQIKKNKQLITK